MRELPKIMRERLAQMPAGPHPDPDLLNAFAEHTLAPRERGLVMAHVSACQECRQLISLAALPLRDAEPTRSFAEPARARLWPGYMRWSGAVAAVLVIGSVAVVYQDLWRRPRFSPPAATATAKIEAAPSSAPQADLGSEEQASKPAESKRAAAAGARRDAQAPVPAPPPPPPPSTSALQGKAVAEDRVAGEKSQTANLAAKTDRESVDPYRGTDERAQVGQLKKEKDEKLDSLALSPAPAAVTPNAAQVEGQRAEQPRAPAAAGLADRAAQVPEVSSEVASGTSEQRTAQNSRVARRAKATSGAYTLGLAGPAASWRINSAGVLERLTDSKSWSTALSVPGVRFTAVAVLGASVWAGGSGGVVYVSTDNGRHWVRRNIQVGGVPVTEDVRAIFLDDAGSGRVDTAGGTYVSVDAGATWSRLHPQQ